jgi:hypothetical protein
MNWRLRQATLDDIDGLHALASMPLVYRYLFDGEAPRKALIADRLARGMATRENAGLGIWLLERSSAQFAGCVELGTGSCRENGMGSDRACL